MYDAVVTSSSCFCCSVLLFLKGSMQVLYIILRRGVCRYKIVCQCRFYLFTDTDADSALFQFLLENNIISYFFFPHILYIFTLVF